MNNNISFYKKEIENINNTFKYFELKISDDEVFTPTNIIDKILNTLPKEVWVDENLKFYNPCCKSGGFLRLIYAKLMDGLKNKIPDETKRKEHILEKQIYGAAVSKITLLHTKTMLYGTTKTNKKNIFLRGSQEHEEWESKMKFDIIIGNPPYQENSDKGTRSSGCYFKFVNMAINLNPNYISMIIPAKWYNINKNNKIDELNKFFSNMIDNNQLVELHDFVNTNDVFPKSVQLGGGVCYFLWDRDYNGECNFYEHKNNLNGDDQIVSINKRYLKNIKSGGIIRYNKALSIIDKIKLSDNNFDSLVIHRMPFGIWSNISDRISHQKNSTNLKILLNKTTNIKDKNKRNLDTYIDKKYVTKNFNLIDKYKIFIAMTNGERVKTYPPYRVFGDIYLGLPGEICSETYFDIANFDTLKEVQNAISYVQTKFFRFLVMMCTSDKMICISSFSLIPIQDWNESWDDQKLYKKYNLTREEINFIESMITTF